MTESEIQRRIMAMNYEEWLEDVKKSIENLEAKLAKVANLIKENYPGHSETVIDKITWGLRAKIDTLKGLGVHGNPIAVLAEAWFELGRLESRYFERPEYELFYERMTRIHLDAERESIQASELKRLAKKGAHASHKEDREDRERIKKYWREHIDNSLSNEEAARRLAEAKIGTSKLTFLKHRTLAAIVREAKSEPKQTDAILKKRVRKIYDIE